MRQEAAELLALRLIKQQENNTMYKIRDPVTKGN